MVDFNKPPKDESEHGGRGEGPYLTPVQQNKIVGMMLAPRRRWKISRAAKREALEATLRNMRDEDGRVRNAAVGNLVRMEAQNQADQHKATDKALPDLHAVDHHLETLRVVIDETRRDASYVELERQRAIAHVAHAGTNGRNGQSRKVGDGSAPSAD